MERINIVRGNGTSTAYQYDAISRLASLAHHFATSSNDVSWTYSYNPASQLASSTRDNNAYAYPLASQDTAETPNGLNQLIAQGGTSYGYDARGNLNTVGAATPYVYSQLAPSSHGIPSGGLGAKRSSTTLPALRTFLPAITSRYGRSGQLSLRQCADKTAKQSCVGCRL